MVRPELLEHSVEEIKASMEEVVRDLEQAGEGALCDIDAVIVLDRLRANRFYTRLSQDKIVVLEGPLAYYNHKKGEIVGADQHIVAQINDDWVIDLASKPGERVYYNMDNFLEKSGIVISSNENKQKINKYRAYLMGLS